MKYLNIFLAVVLSTAILSCDRNGDDKNDKLQELNFHVHTNFGHHALVEGHEYEIDGRKLTFDHVYFYLSGFTLHKENGEDVKLEDLVLLINHENENYKGTMVKPGNYTGYSFYLGVIPALNTQDGDKAKDPSLYPEDHPLFFQTPSMHWSWSTGYIFLNLEGNVDISEAKDGTEWGKMTFHIGNDELVRKVHIHDLFVVHHSLPRTLHLDFDFKKLLEILDLQTEIQTKTMNNFPLAEKIAERFPHIVGSH